MIKKVILIGGGDCADLVISYLKEKSTYLDNKIEVCGILDDVSTKSRCGIPIIGKTKRLEEEPTNLFEKELKNYYLFVSSSIMSFRRRIYEKYKDKYTFISIQQNNEIYLSPYYVIGNHNMIFEKVHINRFSKIGDNNFISTGCIINHHNTIGNSNLLGPGCMFSGSVTIGNNCSIGSGVIIEPRVTIGDNVLITSGSVISGNILSNSRIVGIKDIKYPNIYQGTRKII